MVLSRLVPARLAVARFLSTRLMLAAFVLLAAAMLLVACGDDEDPVDSSPTAGVSRSIRRSVHAITTSAAILARRRCGWSGGRCCTKARWSVSTPGGGAATEPPTGPDGATDRRATSLLESAASRAKSLVSPTQTHDLDRLRPNPRAPRASDGRAGRPADQGATTGFPITSSAGIGPERSGTTKRTATGCISQARPSPHKAR